jgi:hypothetical protein
VDKKDVWPGAFDLESNVVDATDPYRYENSDSSETKVRTAQSSQPILIEKTSKKYKGLQAFGCCLVALSFFFALIVGRSILTGIAVVGVFIGLVIFLFACLGAWWNHG